MPPVSCQRVLLRFSGKDRPIAPGDIQTMPHIGADLVGIERPQVATGGDPLRELAHLLPVEDLQQLRLAEQHDLQQLVAIRLEVGQQAQLFEDIDGEILRLVDDQHGFASMRIGFEQVGC